MKTIARFVGLFFMFATMAANAYKSVDSASCGSDGYVTVAVAVDEEMGPIEQVPYVTTDYKVPSPFAGFYAGVGIGSAVSGTFQSENWNTADEGWNGFREKRDLDPHFMGGVQVGHNWVPEFGGEKLLIGVEVSWVHGGLRGASYDAYEGTYFTTKYDEKGSDFGRVDYSSRDKELTKVSWGIDAILKGGFMPTPRLLVYGKGGFSIARVSTGYISHHTSTFTSDVDGHVSVDSDDYRDTDKGFAAGFVVGGGVDYFPGFLPENVSIGAQFTYHDRTLVSNSHSQEGTDGSFRGHSDESITGFEAGVNLNVYF